MRKVVLILLFAFAAKVSPRAQMTREQIRAMSAKYPPLPRPSNLKVLPPDIAISDLEETMTRFSEGLGVQCTYCHAWRPDHKELDFPSDALPTKAKARVMLQMMNDINGKFLAELPAPRKTQGVTCGNCHAGQQVPPTYKTPPGYILE